MTELDQTVRTLKRLDPKKVWSTDGVTVYFEHEGVCITYPTWDETGRDEVEPSYYGLSPEAAALMQLVNGEP